MKVEVVYAAYDGRHHLLECEVLCDCTVGEAIVQSGIQSLYPEIEITQCEVGIFSQPVSLTSALSPGDRVEIYQPLRIDPKESRRHRQRLREAAKRGGC